jgi:PAS domain S-box-containing protein
MNDEVPPEGLDPKIQAFLEAAPDAIVVVDQEGTIVTVNGLAEEMFGYPRKDLLGHRVEMLVPARFHASHTGVREAYVKNPVTRPMGPGRELAGRRADGSEFPVQISLSPIETAQGVLVTSIIRDVTVQQQAEARFRGLLESAPDGIIVVDEAARIVIVNSEVEKMFGYAREELIGRPIELLVPQRYHQAHVRDRDRYMEAPGTRPMGAGKALTARKKDGTEFPVEISLSPLHTSREKLVTSIVRDVTDRRRAEEQMAAALREKEALLKEIHHRVKNNLQVTSSLLRLQAASIEDPSLRGMFEETQSRIRSIALVHEKLYGSYDLSHIDFVDYVRSLSELLSRSLNAGTDRVSLVVRGRDVFLSIDTAVPCGLIVNELVSNAFKHAFPDGRAGRIEVELRAEEETRSISIADDGAGLPSDFDPESLPTLGLQLVRALVQQISGSLEIERRSPGSAFVLTFPRERKE